MNYYIESANYEYLAKIGRDIHRMYTELVDLFNKELAPYDVTAAQYVVLSALWSGRVETAVQICKEISYTQGTMTRMLDRLEQKQLIHRIRKKDSRREIKLELSAKGKELFPTLFEISGNVLNQHFGVFSMQELNQLETLLNKKIRE